MTNETEASSTEEASAPQAHGAAWSQEITIGTIKILVRVHNEHPAAYWIGARDIRYPAPMAENLKTALALLDIEPTEEIEVGGLFAHTSVTHQDLHRTTIGGTLEAAATVMAVVAKAKAEVLAMMKATAGLDALKQDAAQA